MFEVTQKASEMIKEFLKDKEEIPPIRIMLSGGGWSGPSVGMALDETRENDEIFDDIKHLTHLVGARDMYSGQVLVQLQGVVMALIQMV